MYVAIIAILFSALMISGSLGSHKKNYDECYEKCKKNGFVCDDLTKFRYYQYDPCSYTCSCEYQSQYYKSKDGTECGENHKCYNGYCYNSPQGNDYYTCKKGYYPIVESYNPCSYKCVKSYGCDIYYANADGARCFHSSCCNSGVCCKGQCLGKEDYKDCKKY